MMKKVLCTLLMAAFISPLWAVETEAAPEQKLMSAICLLYTSPSPRD